MTLRTGIEQASARLPVLHFSSENSIFEQEDRKTGTPPPLFLEKKKRKKGERRKEEKTTPPVLPVLPVFLFEIRFFPLKTENRHAEKCLFAACSNP